MVQVNWAALETVKADKQTITMELLELALLNVAMGRERKSLVLSEKVKKMTAYHEGMCFNVVVSFFTILTETGGHALVALLSEGAAEIRRATLVPRGPALGMVHLDNEHH